MRQISKFLQTRKSSLLYEVARGLATMDAKRLSKAATIEQEKAKRSILNMDGRCEYCETGSVNPRRCRSSGDHFMPLVQNKLPTCYCHEPINIIPVCSRCNSSKQSMDFFKWYMTAAYCKSLDKGIRRRVLKKMRAYKVAFDALHTEKKIPKAKVIGLRDEIDTFLDTMDGILAKMRALTTYGRATPPTVRLTRRSTHTETRNNT